MPKPQSQPVNMRQEPSPQRSQMGLLTSYLKPWIEKLLIKTEVTNQKDYEKQLQEATKTLIQIERLTKSFGIIQRDLTKKLLQSVSEDIIQDKKVSDSQVKAYTEGLQTLSKEFKASLTELIPMIPAIEKVGISTEKLQNLASILETANKQDQKSQVILMSILNSLKALDTGIGKLEGKEIEFPIKELKAKLDEVTKAISKIKLEVPKAQEIKIPAMPKSMSMAEGKAILSALAEVSSKLDLLPTSFPELEFPRELSINNFPPQKYPMPVTNIDIRPLRGFIKSTAVTVGSTVIPLPGTPLFSRRSMVCYNNGSGTVYIGGSDVTSNNGMIVPSGTYSPALDNGPQMILYGVSVSGNQDVRVLELSNEAPANHNT